MGRRGSMRTAESAVSGYSGWRAFAAVFGIVALLLGHSRLAHAEQHATGNSSWIVDADVAQRLIENGAVVLDTRDVTQRWWTPLIGSVQARWEELSDENATTKGLLLSNDAVLSGRITKWGVSDTVPVLVAGDPLKGWGEDGRVAWALRALGHSQVYVVNGGAPSLAASKIKISPARASKPFLVRRNPALVISKDELRKAVSEQQVVVLDTREPREFEGETPYGEARGGHIPGAKNLYFRDLVSQTGKVLPREQVLKKLSTLGVSRDTKVVTYCTGGVRSGFVTAVLRDAGIDARNYAGSMWEWSSGRPDEYPLQRP